MNHVLPVNNTAYSKDGSYLNAVEELLFRLYNLCHNLHSIGWISNNLVLPLRWRFWSFLMCRVQIRLATVKEQWKQYSLKTGLALSYTLWLCGYNDGTIPDIKAKVHVHVTGLVRKSFCFVHFTLSPLDLNKWLSRIFLAFQKNHICWRHLKENWQALRSLMLQLILNPRSLNSEACRKWYGF